MVGFARHGLWAMGGGLCSPVVAGCLGGFGCWFGGCLGVGLIGGCLRQWVFGWRFWVAQNNIGISGSCSYSISQVQTSEKRSSFNESGGFGLKWSCW